jgi:hypothetical protein
MLSSERSDLAFLAGYEFTLRDAISLLLALLCPRQPLFFIILFVETVMQFACRNRLRCVPVEGPLTSNSLLLSQIISLIEALILLNLLFANKALRDEECFFKVLTGVEMRTP